MYHAAGNSRFESCSKTFSEDETPANFPARKFPRLILDGTSIVNANPHQDERQDLVQNRKGHAHQHGSAIARDASEDHQEELGDACETRRNTAMPRWSM